MTNPCSTPRGPPDRAFRPLKRTFSTRSNTVLTEIGPGRNRGARIPTALTIRWVKVSVQVCCSHCRCTHRQMRLTHRTIPGRQIPNPRRAAIMQLCNRSAHRAPAGRRGGLDGVLQLTAAFGHRQHGHAFEPKHHRGTTVVVHLGPAFLFVSSNTANHDAPGPFPGSASQPCRPAATTLHYEEPVKMLRLMGDNGKPNDKDSPRNTRICLEYILVHEMTWPDPDRLIRGL